MANKLIDGAVDMFDELTGNIRNTTETYLSLERIIPNVTDLFIDQASEIRMLNKELGNSSKFAADFRKEIVEVSKSIGISSSKTLELVGATKDYHQGITESTESTLKFAKASGASIGVLGKFSAKINLLGNVSAKAHERMYENILSVREAYGLTDEQINDITTTLTNYAVVMQASDEQMIKASTSLSKFTSLLTSAGMEAERVSTILNNMLDPDRMLDNVVLMNKIGITVNDMVSGDPTAKLEAGVDKLKMLGQEIAEIAKTNRLQASELAKVYNLTLQEAIQLSELDTSEKALNTQKKLDEYRNETATLVESLSSFKERLTGSLASFINPILGGFEKLEGSLGLFSKGLVSVGAMIVGKFILGKLKDGVMSIFGQAAKNFGKTVGDYLTQVQGRSLAKGADINGLTPNAKTGSVLNPGFGNRLYFKNRQIKEERSSNRSERLRIKNYDLKPGEIFEGFEQFEQQAKLIKDEISKLPKYQQDYYNNLYAGLLGENGVLNKFKDITKKYGLEKQTSWNDEFSQTISSYNYEKDDKKKASKADSMVKTFFREQQIDYNVNAKDRDSIAEILSSENTKGPREALMALKEFFSSSNAPKAKENLAQVDKALEQMNSTVKENTDFIIEAKEAYKEASEAIKGHSKEVRGERIGNFFKGIGLSLVNNIGKTLKFGALGLAGGIGVKFMASLSKNEKFQETVSSITEKIGTIFDGIVSSIEPVIEPVANAITGLFTIIQPALDWLSKVLGKIAGWFGGVLNKAVSNISTNVAKITDTYKEKDLRDMVKVTASYDAISDTLATKLDDVIYKIEGVHKRQDTQTELSMYAQQQQQ